MQQQDWLEYLKDFRSDLYDQAKEYITKQNEILEKTKRDLQEKDLIVERYSNLISSNYLFNTK